MATAVTVDHTTIEVLLRLVDRFVWVPVPVPSPLMSHSPLLIRNRFGVVEALKPLGTVVGRREAVVGASVVVSEQTTSAHTSTAPDTANVPAPNATCTGELAIRSAASCTAAQVLVPEVGTSAPGGESEDLAAAAARVNATTHTSPPSTKYAVLSRLPLTTPLSNMARLLGGTNAASLNCAAATPSALNSIRSTTVRPSGPNGRGVLAPPPPLVVTGGFTDGWSAVVVSAAVVAGDDPTGSVALAVDTVVEPTVAGSPCRNSHKWWLSLHFTPTVSTVPPRSVVGRLNMRHMLVAYR
jgi:hypothetical protein